MERTRLRRVLLTATVALLVATAGCSGLTGGDGTTDGDGNDANGTGYGVAGSDLDGGTLTDATGEAIEKEGSFTVETTSTTTVSQGNQTRTSRRDVRLRVDLDDDRGIRNRTETIESATGTQTQSSVVYTSGNTSYRERTTGGETTYDQQEGAPQRFGGIQPVDTDGFAQNYTGVVDGFGWEQTGSSEVAGVAVTEYSLTGEPDREALNLGESTTVENASGTLYIDGDGVVRQIDIAYAVTTEQASTSIDATTTLSGVGSTTVEEPDWLSEAA